MHPLLYIKFSADQITISIDGLTVLTAVALIVLVVVLFHRDIEENT